MKQYTVGFSFEESEVTKEDYTSLKVILQGVLKSKQYTIPKVSVVGEPHKYETTVDTFELVVGKYNRILIGQTLNKDVIISEQPVYFKANPQTSLRVKSFYETVLGNLEAYLTDKDNIRASEYEIAGRKLKRYQLKELLGLREKYKSLVDQEDRGINTSSPPRSVIFKI